MLRLIEVRTFVNKWWGRCPACSNEYEFTVPIMRGCADFVPVYCECGQTLGTVRDDYSTSRKMNSTHRIGVYA